MPEDTVVTSRNSRLERFAWFILGFFAVLAYVDVIEVMVPYVLILDGVVAVCAFAFIIYYFYSVKPKTRLDVVNVSFLIFSLFTVISIIVKKGDLDRNVVAVFQIIQMFSSALAVYVLRDRVEDILLYMGYWVIAISLLILTLSYKIFQGAPNNGITINANPFGMMLAIAVLFCFFIFSCTHSNILRFLVVVSGVYLLAGLYVTASRTAILCFLVGVCAFIALILLSKLKRKSRFFVCLVLIVVFAILFISVIAPRIFVSKYSEASTIFTGREIIWKDSIEAAKESMFLGYGGNTEKMMEVFEEVGTDGYTGYACNHFLHNIYLQILIEYGIVVLLGFVVMIIALCLKSAIRFFKVEKGYPIALSFSLMTTLIYLLEGITESNLLYFGGTEQFTFILVLSVLYCDYLNVIGYKEIK